MLIKAQIKFVLRLMVSVETQFTLLNIENDRYREKFLSTKYPEQIEKLYQLHRPKIDLLKKMEDIYFFGETFENNEGAINAIFMEEKL